MYSELKNVLVEGKISQGRIRIKMMKHVRLLVVVRGEDYIVNNMFQSLEDSLDHICILNKDYIPLCPYR